MRRQNPDALTAREREVLDLIRLGLTNEEIAGRLGIIARRREVPRLADPLEVRRRHARRSGRGGASASGGAGGRDGRCGRRSRERRLSSRPWRGLALLAWGVARTDGDSNEFRGDAPRRVDGPVGGPREGIAYCLQSVGVGSEFERAAQVTIETSLPQVDEVRASLTTDDNVPEVVDHRLSPRSRDFC